MKAQQDKEKWEVEKESHLVRVQENMPEEERPNFDRATTEMIWLSENPEIQIPAEVHSDLDNDYE